MTCIWSLRRHYIITSVVGWWGFVSLKRRQSRDPGSLGKYLTTKRPGTTCKYFIVDENLDMTYMIYYKLWGLFPSNRRSWIEDFTFEPYRVYKNVFICPTYKKCYRKIQIFIEYCVMKVLKLPDRKIMFLYCNSCKGELYRIHTYGY